MFFCQTLDLSFVHGKACLDGLLESLGLFSGHKPPSVGCDLLCVRTVLFHVVSWADDWFYRVPACPGALEILGFWVDNSICAHGQKNKG